MFESDCNDEENTKDLHSFKDQLFGLESKVDREEFNK